MKRLFLFAISLASLALVLAACSEETAGGLGETPAEVHVTEAWARSPIDDVGAVYFDAHNAGSEADALVSASCECAGRVEVHETTMVDGEMEMRPIERVEIAPGTDQAFEPGGYHVMLFELTEPLEVGGTITVTLNFENAGAVTVDAEIREYVPEDGMGEGDDGGMG
jgi:copper(I)-binding protein